MKTAILALTFLATLGCNANAGEGLFIGPPPAKFQSQWDAAVSMDLMGPNGSGVIVRIDDINKKQLEVYVLTAYHVWKTWFDSLNGDEKNIVRGLRIDFDFRGRKGEVEGVLADVENTPMASGASGVAIDAEADLTLLRFVIEKEDPNFGDRIDHLKKMRVPKFADCSRVRKGDPVIAFGFPHVDLALKAKSLNYTPKESQFIEKRWSEGVINGRIDRAVYLKRDFGVKNPGMMQLVNIDLVKGGSGGPTFNQDGELLGILSGGTDPIGVSYITRCETSRNFVNEYASSKKMRNYDRPTAQRFCKTKLDGTGVVTSDRSLRSTPFSDGNVGAVKEGAMVEVIADQGLWKQIRTSDGKIGWMSSGAIDLCSNFDEEISAEPSAPQQVQTHSDVETSRSVEVVQERTLRDKPFGESMGLKTIKGQHVEVLSTSGPWVQVRTENGLVGWLDKTSVQLR